MDVHILPILDDNYAYIIQSAGLVGVIDPGESQPVIDYLNKKNLSLDWVINTHKHWDHVNGNKKLIQAYDARWAAPEECGEADEILKGGAPFIFGDIEFEIFATPGHTKGHVILFDPIYRILFAGDTLFAMGCGRVFEGTMEEMYQSMQIIKTLPPETAIYCGHEYTKSNAKFAKGILPNQLSIFDRANAIENQKCTIPTLLADELSTNPFLLAKNVQEFSEYRLKKDNF